MRVGITQPNYLPWLGYFDLLDTVDHWVSLDSAQLARRSFMVRNRIRSTGGDAKWISVSVVKSSQTTRLDRAELVREPVWWEQHLRRMEAAYSRSPRFAPTIEWLRRVLPPTAEDTNLARYNERLVLALCERLGVEVAFSRASSYPEFEGESAQDRILELCSHVGASVYLNFARGIDAGLYDPRAFAARGVQLVGHAYRHPTYPQTGLSEPMTHLSVVDALFELPPAEVRELVRGGSGWRVVE